MDYTKAPSKPAGRGSYIPGSGAMGGVETRGRASNGNGLPIYSPSASSSAVTAIPAAGGAQAVTGPAAAAAPYNARKRRANSGERLRLTMALVITLFYLGLSGVMFSLSMGGSSAGFTAHLGPDGRGIVTYVVPSGPAYDAGVRPGDKVLGSMAPRPSALDAGKLAITSPQGEKRHKVDTLDNDSPLRRWTYALLGLIFIGIGGPVFVKARQRTAASAFYALCISTALAFALATGTVSGLGWVLGLSFMNIVLFAGAFAFFFFKFPIQVGKTPQRHALILSVVVTAGLVPIASYGWVLLGHVEAFDLARSLMLFFLAGCVTAGVINLGRSWFVERSPEVRRQLVLLLGGTAFGVGPALFLFVIPSLLFNHPVVSMDVAAMALGIMPLAFAYAITQHQLLGVRNFIRRGVVYLVMGSSVLLAFSLSAAALGSIAEGWEKQELGLIGFSFFVFLLAFSYNYLQRRVEHLVDRFIYHDAYDYKEALLQFSSQLASEQKLQVLADELVERTCRLMNLMSGVLLVAVHPDENVRANRSRLRPGLISGFLARSEAGQARDRHAYGLEVPGLWSSDNDPLAVQAPAGDSSFYLELYSKYGDFADQLAEDLQDELSAMGIQLHEGDTSRASVRLAGARGMCEADSVRKVASLADAVARPDVSEVMKAGSLGENTNKVDFDAVRSFLGLPLWTRSRFVGVLCLTGKKTGERFTRDDLSLLNTLGSQAALAIYNAQLHEARERALLDTITALAHAIEAKDGYTIQHCEKMTGRAVALAQALDLPRQEVENVRLGAILHDVGKIGIPDAVLNKPSKLTPEEYEIVKEHAAIGARIVQSVGALKGVVPIVHHHQERYDGSGYPLGLSGEDIPIGARIIGVVDTYGAMTEDRVYRKAPGHEAALDELQRLAGKQFDPIVVRAFVQLLVENPDLAEMEYSHAS